VKIAEKMEAFRDTARAKLKSQFCEWMQVAGHMLQVSTIRSQGAHTLRTADSGACASLPLFIPHADALAAMPGAAAVPGNLRCEHPCQCTSCTTAQAVGERQPPAGHGEYSRSGKHSECAQQRMYESS
jgi:hypothetical protein